MKIFLYAILIFLWGLPCGLSARDGSSLKVYFVSSAKEGMDTGNMTEERFWKEVPESSVFILNIPGCMEKYPRTVFRAAANSTYLFIRIDAEEMNPDKLPFTGRTPGRDAGEIFKVGNVEFFFDPGVLKRDAAQVVFSVNGGIYDGITNGNPGWVYEGVVTKTLKGKRSWSMFGAFPWKDKGVDNVFSMTPETCSLIGFNACRGHSTLCYPRSFGTQWSKTPPNSYPRTDAFGILALPVSSVVQQLQKLLENSPGALSLEGALPSDSEKIYRSVLEKVLAATRKNAQALPDNKKEECMKKLDELDKKLKNSSGTAELVKALDECGSLGKMIHSVQINMSDSILEDF
ncbi:MAG: hypothetical protein IKA79_08405 [Lentisphaeria bacterium]|nr:hypothetical protein [Lentisphaeria bacterium]